MISLCDVSLAYSSEAETVHALAGVTFDIEAGQLLTLLGTSGSGKTTLLNVISGLSVPDSGDVIVNDREISRLDESARAHVRLTEVGLVFQDHNLIPEFSAMENVMLPLRGRGIADREASTEAEAMLAAVGLGGLGRRMPTQLSGGQKQRVGIARALVGGRGTLLADEPTGALDSENSRTVFSLLRSLASQGVTVVVATHDPLAREIADRVVLMRDGRVVADDLLQAAVVATAHPA
ncbi:ABC transporter ATP-binding protein [uncultured Amnibacterium sp.]|uniref:ABC transporter ATP-binding protein n=1 Tax=uncultured Amnibacterium sp. TaxID=1631851 RepID=UPI0035C948B3